MTEAFVDPYAYPQTTVLKNKFGERSQQALEAKERRASFSARLTLPEAPFPRTFDLGHLQNIHRHLFQDVYSWAGDLRTVDLTKDSSNFHPHTLLRTGASSIFNALANDAALLDPTVGEDTFVAQAAQLLSDINYLHPFRDGNGRAQRAFLDEVAANSGKRLTWRNTTDITYLLASKETFETGKPDAFIPVLQAALQPPQDGKPILDTGVYEVSFGGPTAKHKANPRWARWASDNGLCGAPTTEGTPCRRRGHCPYHN